MAEVQEKLPCVFELCDDCRVRHIIRESYTEQRIASQVPNKTVPGQDGFQQQMQGMMQMMLTNLAKSLQSMNELQTLAHFCLPCINLMQYKSTYMIAPQKKETMQ